MGFVGKPLQSVFYQLKLAKYKGNATEDSNLEINTRIALVSHLFGKPDEVKT